MKTIEKLNCLNKIKQEYIDNLDMSLADFSIKYKISVPTISKFLKENGIEIRKVFSKKSLLNEALLELNNNTIQNVSEKYGIDTRVLEASKTLPKSKLKSLLIELAILTYLETDGYHRSIESISKRFGINKKTLSKYLKDRNIEITKKCDFANCNEDIFDYIDSEEKAYWLGFMYADGYISTNEYKVGLGVCIQDYTHILKFNQFLNYEHGANIKESHLFGSKDNFGKKGNILYMCTTTITNKHLWEALKEKGCVPHKSLILSFPDESLFKSKDLIYSFIRGYFDGDGSLGMYLHSKIRQTKEASLNFVGTKNFLEGIERYLGKGFLMQKPNCNLSVFRLSYSTKKAINAATLMYKDASIYLNRKYNIYHNEFAAVKSGKNGES